jgi:hypothetical protein
MHARSMQEVKDRSAIAKADITAYLTNIDEAVSLKAAFDCGRTESIRSSEHINHDHWQ